MTMDRIHEGIALIQRLYHLSDKEDALKDYGLDKDEISFCNQFLSNLDPEANAKLKRIKDIMHKLDVFDHIKANAKANLK